MGIFSSKKDDALERATEAYLRREDARGGRSRDAARCESAEYRKASAEFTEALAEATPEERKSFFHWETGPR